MGNRELEDLFNDEKNKYLVLSRIIHFAWFPMGLIFGGFEAVFSPNFESWPKLLMESIKFVSGAYVFTAITFGLLRFLFVYLGVMTYKDFKVYISFFIIHIVFFTAYRFLDAPEELYLYTLVVLWLIILITSFMNRFNNMHQKINEIHEKLNNKH